MSCERPTERVSTLQERNEILRAAKAKYNGYINDMRSRSVEGDSEINTAIIELMNQYCGSLLFSRGSVKKY